MGGVGSTPDDVRTYASCTLLAASLKDSKQESERDEDKAQNGAVEACVRWLLENEFIQILDSGNRVKGKNGCFCVFCIHIFCSLSVCNLEIFPWAELEELSVNL